MREALEKRLSAFCERAKIQLVYIEAPEDAVFIEADGLNAFLNSKLFQVLKDNAANGEKG